MVFGKIRAKIVDRMNEIIRFKNVSVNQKDEVTISVENIDWESEDDYADDPDNWHHDDLEHQEKLNRFTHLAKKMDANKDGFVDKSELISWTLKALQNMDMKELDEDWEVSDHNEDGYISWEEYKALKI